MRLSKYLLPCFVRLRELPRGPFAFTVLQPISKQGCHRLILCVRLSRPFVLLHSDAFAIRSYFAVLCSCVSAVRLVSPNGPRVVFSGFSFRLQDHEAVEKVIAPAFGGRKSESYHARDGVLYLTVVFLGATCTSLDVVSGEESLNHVCFFAVRFPYDCALVEGSN